MANYKETALTGAAWTRCCEIHIANPYNATPIITFKEQRIAELSDGQLVTVRGENIVAEFDPAMVIPVLSPLDGSATGATVAYGDIYALLYSAYMAQAQARDVANQ